MSEASRKRRQRQRERAGQMFAGIWVHRAELEMALVDNGYLSANDADDPRKVVEALQRAVVKILPPA